MSIEDRINLGNRAKEVVENEAYIAAFDAIRKEIDEQWKSSPARDVEGRERLWLMQALLKKLELALQSTMDSGKIAMKDLLYERSKMQRAKEWLSDAL